MEVKVSPPRGADCRRITGKHWKLMLMDGIKYYLRALESIRVYEKLSLISKILKLNTSFWWWKCRNFQSKAIILSSKFTIGKKTISETFSVLYRLYSSFSLFQVVKTFTVKVMMQYHQIRMSNYKSMKQVFMLENFAVFTWKLFLIFQALFSREK